MKILPDGHIQNTNFRLQEFVPRTVYDRYGNNAIWFLDLRLIDCMQQIREFFGVAITVNNWHTGGVGRKLNFRGFRTPFSELGAKYSQHKFGRACDFNVKGMSSEDVALNIIAYEDKFMEFGVTTIEDWNVAVSWTHVDIRHTGLDEILIVRP